MKTPLVRLLFVSLLGFFSLQASHAAEASPAAPPPVADSTTLIADLRGEAPGLFHYGTWKDRLLTSANGITLAWAKGTDGKGGLGHAIEPAMDLSKIAFVEVALGAGAHNEVPEVTVALNDADGTQVAARLRIDQLVPNQPVWLRIRREAFVRVKGQDGSDGKMDWTKVAQWHMQGDWTTTKPCHVVFIAMRVRQ